MKFWCRYRPKHSGMVLGIENSTMDEGGRLRQYTNKGTDNQLFLAIPPNDEEGLPTFPFGMGPKCTIPCPADPADCPNNGAGCNNMTPSYCKAN